MTQIFLGLMIVCGLSIANAENPCKKDRESLCAGKKGRDVMECMMSNKDKLSAECKSFHEKVKGEMKEVREACNADMAKFCSDVKPGKGAKMKCAKENKEKFSAACQKEMNEMKQELHK